MFRKYYGERTLPVNLSAGKVLREINGGAEETRTPDPHVANVVLSQLSYCPTIGGVLYKLVVSPIKNLHILSH